MPRAGDRRGHPAHDLGKIVQQSGPTIYTKAELIGQAIIGGIQEITPHMSLSHRFGGGMVILHEGLAMELQGQWDLGRAAFDAVNLLYIIRYTLHSQPTPGCAEDGGWSCRNDVHGIAGSLKPAKRLRHIGHGTEERNELSIGAELSAKGLSLPRRSRPFEGSQVFISRRDMLGIASPQVLPQQAIGGQHSVTIEANDARRVHSCGIPCRLGN